MKICFELSMPSNNSWNGKWSGENEYYARVVDFGRGKANEEKAKLILAQKSYTYNFGDGWVARIIARNVDAQETQRIRKASRGFMGYDWMIDSIIHKGHIEGRTKNEP